MLINMSAPRVPRREPPTTPGSQIRKAMSAAPAGRAFAPRTVKSSVDQAEDKEKARIARSGPLAIHACKFKRLTFPSGYLATVRETVVVSVKPPPVPVMVMV